MTVFRNATCPNCRTEGIDIYESNADGTSTCKLCRATFGMTWDERDAELGEVKLCVDCCVQPPLPSAGSQVCARCYNKNLGTLEEVYGELPLPYVPLSRVAEVCRSLNTRQDWVETMLAELGVRVIDDGQ